MKAVTEFDLSIIIVNFNTADELRTCIQSVKKHTKEIRYEIIVVDNNSKDHSKAILESEFPDVTSYFLHYNSGFSIGNNYAMERSNSKYILLLNPDTALTENSFLQMYKFLENNNAAGAVGPVVKDIHGNFRLTIRNFPSLKLHLAEALNIKSLIKRFSLTKKQYAMIASEKSFEVDWISGGSFMVRRSIFNDIGGLDERFHLFAEDLDWCIRIKKSGWKVFCLPKIKIIHIGGVSTHKNYFILVSNRYRSKLIFAQKYSNRSELFILRVLVLLGLLLRLFISIFKRYSGENEKQERMKAYLASFFIWLGNKKMLSRERLQN